MWDNEGSRFGVDPKVCSQDGSRKNTSSCLPVPRTGGKPEENWYREPFVASRAGKCIIYSPSRRMVEVILYNAKEETAEMMKKV